MDITEVKQTLCGPMIPVISVLKPDLSLDIEGTQFNVRDVVERGFTRGKGVLLAVGAGGDFPMMTVQERKDVTRAIVDAAVGKVPVLTGAQDTDPKVCIEIAQFAEEVGAYGIQLSAPYYYQPSDDDVIKHVTSIHDATERIAIMIYNTWWHGYNMPLDVLDTLSQLDRVVSLKWSTPDGAKSYTKGISRFSGRLAIVDNQGLQVLSYMLGGTGYITHLATVWPEHDLSLHEQMKNGDYMSALEGFKDANWPWGDFRGKMAQRTGGEANVVKAALELCGRPAGPSRPPTRALNSDEREELRQLLIKIGVPNVK